MALDLTGNWVAGDDLRIVEALMLPFGSYTLQCTQDCCNQLENMSPEAVLRVRTLLDEYEAAKNIESTANLADTEGKTLVRADVLAWQRNGAGEVSGPQMEMMRTRNELGQYFAFCSCMGGLQSSGTYGMTSLIRS